MTLRSLKIFTEVCKHMNMSRAAQSLMISQSSVSQAIASLENEYGILLFERFQHSLYLTQAGKQMLFLSSQILKDVDLLELQMKNASFQNQLTIGACTTIGNCLIYPLLERYYEICKDTKVRVEINNSGSLEKKVLEADLDLAIVQSSAFSPFLEHIPLLKDQLIIICWNNHHMAGKTIKLCELQDEWFIGRENGSGTKNLVENAFLSQGFTLKTSWICNSIDSVKQAVFHHSGIAVISRFLVQKDLQEGRFSFIDIEDFQFSRQFDLVFHKDKNRDISFRKFADLCTKLGEKGLLDLIL